MGTRGDFYVGRGKKAKIKKLTPEHLAMLHRIRDEWLAKGIATGPIDRAAADRSVKYLYSMLGRDLIATLVLPSPLSSWLAVCMLVGGYNDKIIRQLYQQVGDQVWDQVREQVGEQVGDQVREQVGDQVGDQVWDQIPAFVWPYMDNQFSAGWLAWCVAMEAIGVQLSNSHLPWWYDTVNYGPMWPLERVCVVSERPTAIHIEDGRLHRDGGPAIEYSDGFSVWAYRGVRVQRWVVETPADDLRAQQVLDERNQEVRAVLLDRYGTERFIADAGGKLQHEDEWGVLYRVDRLDAEPYLAVKVVNATPEPNGSYKDYWLRVPPEMTTAREAVAWTFGMGEREYQPAAES